MCPIQRWTELLNMMYTLKSEFQQQHLHYRQFLTICPDTNLQFLEWKPKTK